MSNDLPWYVKEAAARKSGPACESKALGGADFPPEYFALVERLGALIRDWYVAEPQPPKLRWHVPDNEIVITGNLDVAAQYLADSPDAFRLLAWLDEKTNRQASLYQTTWALRLVRLLPMPDGTYYGQENVRESAAFLLVRAWASRERETRLEGSPCGHCGQVLDAASGKAEEVPEPGAFTLCFECFGFNRFDDALRLQKVTPEEFAALPADFREQLDEMVALLRVARMGQPLGGPGKGDA